MFFSFSTAAAAAVALLGLMVASASRAASNLNCSCTTLPGGKVRFDLSPAPPDDCLEARQWLLLNGTAIVAKDDFDRSLVLSVTRQSLTLKAVLGHVQFNAWCSSGYFEADCTSEINTLLSPANHSSPTPAPEISSERGPVPVPVPVPVTVTVLVPMALVLVLLPVWFLCPKFKRWTQKIPPWIQTRTPACIRSRVCGTEPPPSSSSPEFEKVPLSDVPRTETV
ncbi:unnamed protein product [Knipowitschia caucasica]|uniref:Uncharacterized protein n=1 Tax=Knipowitschia caucasica TaxID=637954 RepID=A0AAV2KRS9_KNICA